jgi:hypothetical protein
VRILLENEGEVFDCFNECFDLYLGDLAFRLRNVLLHFFVEFEKLIARGDGLILLIWIFVVQPLKGLLKIEDELEGDTLDPVNVYLREGCEDTVLL